MGTGGSSSIPCGGASLAGATKMLAENLKRLAADALEASAGDLEIALKKAKKEARTTAIVIDTDALVTTQGGGTWWEVAVPEVSPRKKVNAARKAYEQALKARALVN